MRIEARFRVNGRATPLIAARRNGRLLGTRTVLQEIQSRVDLCPFVIMLSRSIKLSQRLPAHQVRSYSRSRAGNTRLSSLNKPPSVRPSNSAYWAKLTFGLTHFVRLCPFFCFINDFVHFGAQKSLFKRIATQTSNWSLQTSSNVLIPRLRPCYDTIATAEFGDFGMAARTDDKMEQDSLTDSLVDLMARNEIGQAYITLMDSIWDLEEYDLSLSLVAFKIFIATSDVQSAQIIHDKIYTTAYEEMEGEDIAALAKLCARTGDFKYGIEILTSRLNWMLQQRNYVPAELGSELFERLGRLDDSEGGLSELLDSIGDLLCLTGDSTNAARAYRTEILHKGKDVKLSTLILGLMVYDRHGSKKELLEACTEAEQNHPRTKEVKMFKARAIWQLLGPAAVNTWLERESKSELGSDFLWPWKVHILLKRGEPAAAKQLMAESLEEDKRAGRKFAIVGLLEIARCYELLGQHERVLDIVEYTMQDAKSLTFDSRELIFDLVFNDLKDSKLAIKVLKRMATDDIYEVMRLKREAEVYAREKDDLKCIDAILEFSQYVDLAASDHAMKGNALLNLHRYEEAIEEYRLAQSKECAYEFFAKEIVALLHAGKWDEALYSFNRLETKYDHESDTALVPMAYFLSGCWEKYGTTSTPPQYIDLPRASALHSQSVRIHNGWKCKPHEVQLELENQIRSLGIESSTCTVEELFYRL